ncbi:MAG: hypothetical protein CM15mP12_0640 [Gammaproteobacteria bacterium]|nr:MAG: hypothetical protein CM15mP12_0640 [Gammaproteobacteria bacterium]
MTNFRQLVPCLIFKKIVGSISKGFPRQKLQFFALYPPLILFKILKIFGVQYVYKKTFEFL